MDSVDTIQTMILDKNLGLSQYNVLLNKIYMGIFEREKKKKKEKCYLRLEDMFFCVFKPKHHFFEFLEISCGPSTC